MTVQDLEHFKDLLLERQATVTDWLEAPPSTGRKDVEKAQKLLGQIRDAIKRIEKHSYGTCVVCNGEVELHRLEVQPVTEVCLTCITKQEQAELEEDLFLASKVHRALLPQIIARIDGFDIAAKSIAARIVGGDYYDIISPDDGGTTKVVVADVMGKGIQAGMLMSNVQGALRILAEQYESPAELTARLNRWLCRNIPVTKFVSLACVSIEPGRNSTARLVQTNAGHCPPFIVRANGSVEAMELTGGVLGVHEDFDFSEVGYDFGPGDLLVMYTDGVTEAVNDKGEMFGEQCLVDFVAAHHKDSLQSIVDGLQDHVSKFCSAQKLEDDFTVVLMRKLPVA
jgi:sigma-B regulation protein RsbU (phosphoserine phosphatase)